MQRTLWAGWVSRSRSLGLMAGLVVCLVVWQSGCASDDGNGGGGGGGDGGDGGGGISACENQRGCCRGCVIDYITCYSNCGGSTLYRACVSKAEGWKLDDCKEDCEGDGSCVDECEDISEQDLANCEAQYGRDPVKVAECWDEYDGCWSDCEYEYGCDSEELGITMEEALTHPL